jgi:replicative DNA helicase
MIEQEYLACALQNPNVLTDHEVKSHQFESPMHQAIYQAMIDAGKSYDAALIANQLWTEGEQSASNRVLEIVADCHGIQANCAQYAEKIRNNHRNRVTRQILAEGIKTLDSGEVIRKLMELDKTETSQEISITQAMAEALEDMEAAAQSKGIRGITTGLNGLDKHLGGWHRGDLCVIGARPAMGKTALMLHFAQSCGVPLGLVSAEQPAYQIAQRHVASIGKVRLSDLRQGKIGENETKAVITANHRLKNYWIYDRSSPSIDDIVKMARRWKHKHGIKILFVDYIQRIQGNGKVRHEQVGDVVRGLKTLARDLDIPVVALAQVSRQVESRQDMRPNMGDLSDSSEIEKEADQIVTMYREEVYNENTKEPGICELKVCKNRHGYTGTVAVKWIGKHVSFGNLEVF